MKRSGGPSIANQMDADYVLDAEMQEYAGKWVAVVRHKVVAVGDNVKTVVDQAKAKGYKEPLIMRAPEQGVWIL